MKILREIKVAEAKKALELMLSMLFANMLDNELQTDEATGKYKIRFGWFSRDCDAEDRVGCPCFIGEYHGFVPGEDKVINAIVYVKAFAVRNGCITKMHFIGENKNQFHLQEILDGEKFIMDETGSYKKEEFMYSNGNVVRL